jgi:glycosyltransferase involved in cell wall biosynthesis
LENFVSNQTSIIYIHHERAIGGAPLSLLFLLQKLNRDRYQPYVICLREGPAADLFRKNGFEVKVVPGPDLSHTELVWFRWWQFPKFVLRLIQSFFLFFKLRKEIFIRSKTNPKTIVHLNSSTLVIAALATKSLSIPLVWHIREPLAMGYFGIRRASLRMWIRILSDHIIAICHNDADQLGENIDKSKLSVIYNFVDFTQFDEKLSKGSIRKELSIDSDAWVILFLGGSAYVKGAYVLLRAIPRIFENLRSAHVLIAGEITSDYQIEIKEIGANFRDRIHLLGSRSDVPLLLADCNVLLFPSTVPHFARPIIEAAAMGKPAIGSDLAGVRELIVRNETGLLIPPNDPLALSQAIIELAKNEAQAFRLGQQGLALAREKFDANRNSALTFSIYEALEYSFK